jgi:prepilin signal peptidase PulO-like enzyme (type II secretory pathway)
MNMKKRKSNLKWLVLVLYILGAIFSWISGRTEDYANAWCGALAIFIIVAVFDNYREKRWQKQGEDSKLTGEIKKPEEELGQKNEQ